MNSKTPWSRRALLQGIGYASALGVLNKLVPAEKVTRQDLGYANSRFGFAYVASAGNSKIPADDAAGIDVFEVNDDAWKWKQRVSSPAPVSLTLHPNQQVLYVANEVDEHEGLPRGTVEAYRVDAHDGTLALINRQSLSLSAIRPRHLAISPDGNYLVVAIHGGGAFNLLPIQTDGAIGRVTQILKEVGAGPHPIHQTSAHPYTVMFDAGGQHLLTTDEGCDRINVFAFRNGRIFRTVQALCMAASGPGHFAILPSGNFLYVFNRLNRSIDAYRWQAHIAEMKHEQHVPLSSTITSDEGQPLVLSSSGKFLYSAFGGEGILLWGVDPVNGNLSLLQQWKLKSRSLISPRLSSDDQYLYVIDIQKQEVLSFAVHVENGELGSALVVAKTVLPKSLIMKSGSVTLS